MLGIFNFMEGYNHFMKIHSDPRTKDWFLVGKLGHLILILVTYVYFCTKIGPKLMKNKKPFELKKTIQIYNLLQVFASVYLFYEGLAAGWATDYNYTCQPLVPGEKGMRMAKAVYFYFICKLVELLDTVFFILRKKYNQVTYLHLYHHTIMPMCAWIGVTFFPGGHGTLLGLINCFIHVIMYVYYFLSSLGPQYQPYLWWKKYVTKLQMIQFCIVFWHNFQVLFKSCDYPKFLNILLASQAAYFLYLFGCFYVNSYIKNKKSKLDHEVMTNRVSRNGLQNGQIKNNSTTNGHLVNDFTSVDPFKTSKTKAN
ncbi:elongation of very long chain fatty acids protein AAEL008004-like [Diorhabda sublineata]|uniref:elongation of very long chain fatty acids protein AAEL008004-like n=1 Tax=Diorhabda sublineata TaxID=1163346 RepID=UPI0024E10304|nr:elongation of very long chain fatty acids protein AAEL008004-like [Diorhabda sublineata]